MLNSDEMVLVRGIIVDVIYNRPLLRITHAVVAIDLGDDFPILYQPIRLGLLRSMAEPNTFAVQGSSDAIAETLPDFMEYQINIGRAGSGAPEPFPRSCRTH
jgi:hypothetical protein